MTAIMALFFQSQRCFKSYDSLYSAGSLDALTVFLLFKLGTSVFAHWTFEQWHDFGINHQPVQAP